VPGRWVAVVIETRPAVNPPCWRASAKPPPTGA